MSNNLPQPIFIIGAPRSGTTLLHRLLCRHPHVSWLSAPAIRYPHRPTLNQWVMRAFNYPLVGKLIQGRLRPWEGYDFWEHHCPGFRRPYRDLTAHDVTIKIQKSLPHILHQLTIPQRPRLLLKITGWPRIGFLHQLFPDAKFIHIVRDGRAVANSLINTDFWRGWEGPSQWRWGELSQEQTKRWAETGHSFVALAGIQWEILLHAIRAAQAVLTPTHFYELKYEELCTAPQSTLQKVTEFCQLSWAPPFATHISTQPIRNQNDKWQKELTPTQQHHLTYVIQQELIRYNYELHSSQFIPPG